MARTNTWSSSLACLNEMLSGRAGQSLPGARTKKEESSTGLSCGKVKDMSAGRVRMNPTWDFCHCTKYTCCTRDPDRGCRALPLQYACYLRSKMLLILPCTHRVAIVCPCREDHFSRSMIIPRCQTDIGRVRARARSLAPSLQKWAGCCGKGLTVVESASVWVSY